MTQTPNHIPSQYTLKVKVSSSNKEHLRWLRDRYDRDTPDPPPTAYYAAMVASDGVNGNYADWKRTTVDVSAVSGEGYVVDMSDVHYDPETGQRTGSLVELASAAVSQTNIGFRALEGPAAAMSSVQRIEYTEQLERRKFSPLRVLGKVASSHTFMLEL